MRLGRIFFVAHCSSAILRAFAPAFLGGLRSRFFGGLSFPLFMRYWLLKSEPLSYSIDDMARDRVTAWSGVRNYQARNFMRDQMRVGDRAFFYHSNCDEPGIVGIVEVCGTAHADETLFDRRSTSRLPGCASCSAATGSRSRRSIQASGITS